MVRISLTTRDCEEKWSEVDVESRASRLSRPSLRRRAEVDTVSVFQPVVPGCDELFASFVLIHQPRFTSFHHSLLLVLLVLHFHQPTASFHLLTACIHCTA